MDNELRQTLREVEKKELVKVDRVAFLISVFGGELLRLAEIGCSPASILKIVNRTLRQHKERKPWLPAYVQERDVVEALRKLKKSRRKVKNPQHTPQEQDQQASTLQISPQTPQSSQPIQNRPQQPQPQQPTPKAPQPQNTLTPPL